MKETKKHPVIKWLGFILTALFWVLALCCFFLGIEGFVFITDGTPWSQIVPKWFVFFPVVTILMWLSIVFTIIGFATLSRISIRKAFLLGVTLSFWLLSGSCLTQAVHDLLRTETLSPQDWKPIGNSSSLGDFFLHGSIAFGIYGVCFALVGFLFARYYHKH